MPTVTMEVQAEGDVEFEAKVAALKSDTYAVADVLEGHTVRFASGNPDEIDLIQQRFDSLS